MATLDLPRLTMCVVGNAYGRLSLDVIRSSRSLLFFFWTCPEPSPSTSARGRVLFGVLRRSGVDEVDAEGNANVGEGRSSVEKVKRSWLQLGLAVVHWKRISTVFKVIQEYNAALYA